MKLNQRDRRALTLLGGAVAVYLLLQLALPKPGTDSAAAGGLDSIPAAERTLARLRQIASTVPGKEEALKKVQAELADREKLLIVADTAQQAQAHLVEILRNIAKEQQPPLDLKSLELGQVRPFGNEYGEVVASATVECKIEDLVNLLAAVTAQKEMVALSEFRVSAQSGKQKTMSVRLTVSGLMPKKLLPEKKGLGSF